VRGVVPRRDALRGLQAWRREVHEKREAWVGGDRSVVFPVGVYGLWKFHGALVVDARPRATPASVPGTVAIPVTSSTEARARPG
jgi:hypothetical protein